MVSIAEARKKLSELYKLKHNRTILDNDRRNEPVPKTEEELIEDKRKEYSNYTDEELGIKTKCTELPTEPVFTPPEGVPQKKTVQHYPYNIILMLRPIVFAILTYITFFVKGTSPFILATYVVVWIFLWIFVGSMSENKSFSFLGLWLGFWHIFMLVKLPGYFAKKIEAKKYNDTVYPKLLDEYNEKYNQEKKDFNEKYIEYEKEVKTFYENVQKRKDERETAIENLISKYTLEAKRIANETKIVYDEKIKSLDEQIAKYDEQIEPYSSIDDSIIFDVKNHSAEKINGIIKVIDSGRASTLKEAITVYLDDERKSNEEWHRREEAEKMARIAEYQAETDRMRAREEERHNYDMEYAEQSRKRQEAEYNRKQFELQESQAKAEAKRLCNSCKYKGSCSHVITGDPPINCTKYRGIRD